MATCTGRVLVPWLDKHFIDLAITVGILDLFWKLGYDFHTIDQVQVVSKFVLGSDIFVTLTNESRESLHYGFHALLTVCSGLLEGHYSLMHCCCCCQKALAGCCCCCCGCQKTSAGCHCCCCVWWEIFHDHLTEGLFEGGRSSFTNDSLDMKRMWLLL